METGQTLDREYSLSREQLETYRRDGHILLRGVASRDDIETYRPSIERILRESVVTQDSQGRIEDYSSLFQQVTNIWRLDETARRFVFARRFARIAADLMGVDGVRLYHDQALFKPAGGKTTPWHQDQFYWPLSTHHTITMWMPLVELTQDMGTMIFASGSHQRGPLMELSISDESHRRYEALIKDHAYPLVSHDLAAGDATFHAGWTVHAAHPNNGKTVRKVMTIIYYADGATVIEPDNEFRKADMEVFHPGLRPGDAAASHLNPLLFRRTGGGV
jgi:ectoine hydroxylase-related dioxygenase (phytanoyl-CoA dioxygenase family)